MTVFIVILFAAVIAGRVIDFVIDRIIAGRR